TPQQWTVLAALAQEDGPATAVGIARTLGVTKQNMTGMIARLEQLGVAERHGDPADLRSSRVALTRRGRTLVEKTRPAYEEWIRSLTSGDVTERDLQTVTRVVEKLIARME
ncbi:MAG TPA: MarR family transcriptional regulator, partial [Thermoanaerobaculia bacterium]|nr:MarR family transcriptional regulator [Thermoanaerobaculia bacterium]